MASLIEFMEGGDSFIALHFVFSCLNFSMAKAVVRVIARRSLATIVSSGAFYRQLSVAKKKKKKNKKKKNNFSY